jgi:RimJ/RimL family protein N-acetyltransferase
MATSPILHAPRLRLEPFGPAFLREEYVSWLNDSENVRYSDQRFRRHTLESCREYSESFEGSANYLWAIVLRAGDRHVGNTSATVDVHHRTADLAVLIGRSDHGQGYAFEAWTAAIDYLLRSLSLRKITAGTMAVNAGMRAVMKKLGMREDVRRERQFLLDGQEIDMVGACVFREEWLERFPRAPFE